MGDVTVAMGPIEGAIDAMICAQLAFRQHGLLKDDECLVCCRMLKPGAHTSDCPVDRLRLTVQRLTQFKLSL